MPEGGAISIEAVNRLVAADEILSLESGHYVLISIADQGSGIPPEHLGRIFDPYFTTKKTGSGLGLTSLYSIVRKHGGQVQVFSNAGLGARFDVYLPACPDDVPGEEASAGPHISEDGHGYVLVMDDEQAIREVAEEMLLLFGYKAMTCANGNELIELYSGLLESGHKPDATIVDLTIPGGMGGLEAAARLLEIDPSAMLIVTSGYSNDAVMANYQDHGFVDTLVKPFRVEDLYNALNRLPEWRESRR